MHNDFSALYDRFNDWPARLAREIPVLVRWLERARARTVLDASCGTGRHAIALAQRGYRVTGSDLSEGMIARSRQNAAAEGVDLPFVQASFAEVGARFPEQFDAVLCLGNSLPLVPEEAELSASLVGLRAALKPGGFLLLQSRNFDKVLAEGERFLPLKVRVVDGQEWLFWRFYDFLGGGQLQFNVVILRRLTPPAPPSPGEVSPTSGEAEWGLHVQSTPLRAWTHAELTAALQQAGFVAVESYGDYEGTPFRAEASPDLVLVACQP